jgi:uncharacterized protein (TIGR02145 family)
MAENLNYQSGLTFNQRAGEANGQPYTSMDNGVAAIGSFWCPAISGATLSADKNTCNVYGALYTWETAMSPDGKGTWDESAVSSRYRDANTTPADAQNDPIVQGICPTGWHLPSDYEWATLLNAVDPACGSYTAQVGDGRFGTDAPASAPDPGAGVKLKSAATYTGADHGIGAWLNHDSAGSDAHSFCLLPAGRRTQDGSQFYVRGNYTRLNISTPAANSHYWTRVFVGAWADVQRQYWSRSAGEPVRCLQN